MNGFRIIAIKTGKAPSRIYNSIKTGAKLDPYKVLKPNTVYPFNSLFTFPKDDFSEISYNQIRDFDLYSLTKRNKIFQINISAIVGENGSGKSSLIELLYWASYNIGCSIELLKNEESGKTLTPYKFLELEILYSTFNDSYFIYSYKDGFVYCQKLVMVDSNLQLFGERSQVKDISQLSTFFYSIVVNYSHYALNSNEIGDWIIPLFHKNDGYQTPIVLNPMRIDGNIDINTEKRLLSRRLQANILEDIENKLPKNSLRNIANDKIAKSLILRYNSNHYPYTPLQETKNGTILKNLLIAIKKHFKFEITEIELNENFFVNITLNYLIEKLIKISTRYRPFRKFYLKDNGKDSIKWVDAYIKKIKSSDSHIIFKVKGAILYLKYYKEIFETGNVDLKKDIILDIDQLSKKIVEINFLEDFWVNTFMMSPPGYFFVDILLGDNSSLDALSSGEKQRIHSISSILYHLINLNSVSKLTYEQSNEKKYVNYSNINVVLDEIELYYHPEWQRKYVSDLLTYIERINPKNIDTIEGINFIIATHSPYILSDIPDYGILKLDKGNVIKSDERELTFGANIHELLTHSFFMNNTIGEYSLSLIKKIVEFHDKLTTTIDEIAINDLRIQYADLEPLFKFVIENIGEKYIRGILKNHIEKIETILQQNTDEAMIEKLEEELQLLKEKRDAKNKLSE